MAGHNPFSSRLLGVFWLHTHTCWAYFSSHQNWDLNLLGPSHLSHHTTDWWEKHLHAPTSPCFSALEIFRSFLIPLPKPKKLKELQKSSHLCVLPLTISLMAKNSNCLVCFPYNIIKCFQAVSIIIPSLITVFLTSKKQ